MRLQLTERICVSSRYTQINKHTPPQYERWHGRWYGSWVGPGGKRIYAYDRRHSP